MTEIDLNLHIDNIVAYAKDWETNDWRGMPYAAFEALARMFPAPCQELYPLRIDPETGETKVLLMRRPETDKYYGGMWHNPGTAHRSTDGVTATSLQNVAAINTVPGNVLDAEMAKPTWVLTPREKALHRVLSGREIGLSSEEALLELSHIHDAGVFPMELTPRGSEIVDLNVWLPTAEQVENIELSERVAWHDVTKLYLMALGGKFIEHQVNRFAQMMDYVRAEINSEAPELKRLRPAHLMT